MATELFANTIGSSAASTVLSGNSGGAITSGATTLKVASNNGFSVTGGQMRAVIEPGTANAEVVIITGIATLTFTVTRGQEGTTAVAHNDGSVFIAEVTAGALGNMLQTLAGSDGNYYIRRSGLWAPGTPSYNDLSDVPATFTPTDGSVTDAKVSSSAAIAESKLSLASDAVAATASRRTLGTGSTQATAGNDSRLTNARTPTAHASTHLPGGGDATADLSYLTAHPKLMGYLGWSLDWAGVTGGVTPTAGVVYLAKIMTPYAYTVNNIAIVISRGGTGTTSLANCFVGLYSSDGVRRFVSTDQHTPWAANGVFAYAVSGGYLVTAADYIYVAVLIGTQASTPAQLACGSTVPGLQSGWAGSLTAAAMRFASNGSLQTSLPAPITLASNFSVAVPFAAAVY